MKMKNLVVLIVGICCFCSCSKTKKIKTNINWSSFLSRHDMIWKKVPTEWTQAPFFGNGLVGSMLYKDGDNNRFRIHVFRSDVQEHRGYEHGHAGYSRYRMQIGSFYFQPSGKILGCDWRLDYYNAELHGKIITEKGEINIRHFVHTDDMIIYTELTTSDGEKACTWTWEPADPSPTRPGYVTRIKDIPKIQKNYNSTYPTVLYDANPQPRFEQMDGINVCTQDLTHGGQHATAWTVLRENNSQIHLASIDKIFPKEEPIADRGAVETVKKVASLKNRQAWQKQHNDWWNNYYPASFVSLPDTRLETVYWTQMYKLASATRSDRPMMDTAGLWQTPSKWPFVTWNLNVQLCYWPPFPANRIHVGESLINTLWKYRENLINNVRPVEWQKDAAFVGLNSGLDLDQPWGLDLRNIGTTLGNLVWTMHDVWLHYRYTMDDTLLRNKVFPLLRRSVNFMIYKLYEKEGEYHLPPSGSPEYGEAPDCNYDLALLRWGCQTLIQCCQRLEIDDPLIPKWKDILTRLADYSTDETGYMVGQGVPFVRAHRHYSHLLMIYPLYLVNVEQSAKKDLIKKSLEHWLTTNYKEFSQKGNWGVFAAYTHTGASSMYAALGDGENALKYLNGFADYPLVRRNSLYAESGPVLESPLSAAQCVHDMLLQSWGDKIRIFPAVPYEWDNLVFQNLRAEGAFLVSASRKGGETKWVRIKSLVGEPCRVKPDLSGEIKTIGSRSFKLTKAGEGVYDVDLQKGEEVILYSGDSVPDLNVHPCAAQEEKLNWYGLQ